MKLDVLDREISVLQPLLQEIRHDLHQHPELGFEEVRTQKIVREWLTQHGYAPRTMAETGLVADLHPERVGRAPTIALRADLDCLPMEERTDLPYRSVHKGRAHKCGHDGHTAILMGVAVALAKHREIVPGNVRLIFQPAEEGVRGGGARVMIEEGALDGVNEIYGLHNWPGAPKGCVQVKSGAMMAQVHTFLVDLVGIGGHGSQPHRCRDPIVAGAQIVSALQSIVSRGLGYEGGAVVSVTQFQAGTTHNVIPERAHLSGTIRSFSPAITERVLTRFSEIVNGTALALGVRAEIEIIPGYPVVMNDELCADAVRRVATRIVGREHVNADELPLAGGEDFAYFADKVPGAYFLLGAKRPGEDTPVCHHPDFDFDDDLIELGVRMFVGLVADRASQK